jgi:probable HAF family extracellular repeat protein
MNSIHRSTLARASRSGAASLAFVMRMSRTTTLVAAVLMVVEIVPRAAAQTAGNYLYSDGVFTTLNLSGFARGINYSGEIVGTTSNRQGFIYDDGNYTYLNASGATEVDFDSINNNGQVLGHYYYNYYTVDNFIYTNGSYQSFMVDGVPTGINDSGEIVGYSGTTGGFVIGAPSPTDRIFSEPTGVNDRGQIIGNCYDLCGSGAFLYTNGLYTLLKFPGSTLTQATGINDEWEVVGLAQFANGDTGGYLYDDGVYTPIDFGPLSPYNYTYATSINDSGDILGTFYLGINTPELSTWAMTVLGFAGLGYAGYRKRECRAA